VLGRFESRVRRLKLACSKWKTEYQRDVQRKCQEMVTSLEDRYMLEIEALLEEVSGRLGMLQQVFFS
jgi:hypothetical protein